MPKAADGYEYTLSGPTWDEPHKLICMARHVCRLPREERIEYMEGWEKRRGAAYGEALKQAVLEQWAIRDQWIGDRNEPRNAG